MRILLVHPSADLYGSDRMVAISAEALVKRGHTVTVVLAGDGPLVHLLEQSRATVAIIDTPVLRKTDLSPSGFVRLLFQVIKCQRRIARMLRATNPDVVYINTIVQPWWIAGSVLRRKPVVVHVREAEIGIRRFLKICIYSPLMLASSVLCNSESTRRDIVEALPAADEKTKVVYNGKDWSAYERANVAARCDFESHPGEIRLAVIGRLSPRKGQDLAVRALAEIVLGGTNATLTLTGDVFPGYEWYEAELRQLSAELGVSDLVTFSGFQDNISSVLGSTDIAIVPSRIEPFGTVAAECMAAGLPTIAADIQGLAEIVVDGETGLTFTADDYEALAKCCKWVISNPAESRQIALRGQHSVKERFSLERYESDIISSIEGIVTAGRR